MDHTSFFYLYTTRCIKTSDTGLSKHIFIDNVVQNDFWLNVISHVANKGAVYLIMQISDLLHSHTLKAIGETVFGTLNSVTVSCSFLLWQD